MSGELLQALLPQLVLAIAATVLILQIALKRHHTTAWLLCCAGLVGALLALEAATGAAPRAATALLVVDRFGLALSLLLLLNALLVALLARDHLRARPGQNEEFYALLLLATLGALLLVAARHVAAFILGLELLSIALYALIAWPVRRRLPLEAAIKYLVLSAAASSILLFGFALLYAALGTMDFAAMGASLMMLPALQHSGLVLAGAALVTAGVAFKLSLTPFHLWTPDVYQGAPTPVAAFLASVAKVATAGAFLRFYLLGGLHGLFAVETALWLLALLSIVAGNLLALRQDNLKRLLGYSSIAHMGYLLVPFVLLGAAPSLALEAAIAYLIAYSLSTLGAFAALDAVRENRDQPAIADIQGLFWRRPLAAVLLAVAMLSLAGIPLTIGFIGKFYLFSVALAAGAWALLAALVAGSVLGLYYYLRVIFALGQKPEHADTSSDSGNSKAMATAVGIALLLMMLVAGILPQPLMSWLEAVLQSAV